MSGDPRALGDSTSGTYTRNERPQGVPAPPRLAQRGPEPAPTTVAALAVLARERKRSDKWRARAKAAQADVRRLRGQVKSLAAAVDGVRHLHPRGDEEPGTLAPGLWCPGCGAKRADSGNGGCPVRAALAEVPAR